MPQNTTFCPEQIIEPVCINLGSFQLGPCIVITITGIDAPDEILWETTLLFIARESLKRR